MVGRDDRDNPGKQSRVAPIPCNKSVLSFCSSIRTKYSMYVRKYCNPSLIYGCIRNYSSWVLVRALSRKPWFLKNFGRSEICESSCESHCCPWKKHEMRLLYSLYTYCSDNRSTSCFPNNNTDTARTTMTNVVDQTKHFFYSVSL